MFSDEDSARRWFENTKLWSTTTNPVKLHIPIEWAHDAFDQNFKIRSCAMGPPDVVGRARGSGH